VPFNIILRPDPESDPKQKPKPESGTSLLFDSNILFMNSVWVKNMVSKFLRLGLSNRSQREGANVWIPPGGGVVAASQIKITGMVFFLTIPFFLHCVILFFYY